MNVGFIGLGAMGLPMARRVLSAGHTMYTTFHRRLEPAEELRAMGATVLATPAEVAAVADVVITILPADAELREVVFGATGILRVVRAQTAPLWVGSTVRWHSCSSHSGT